MGNVYIHINKGVKIETRLFLLKYSIKYVYDTFDGYQCFKIRTLYEINGWLDHFFKREPFYALFILFNVVTTSVQLL